MREEGEEEGGRKEETRGTASSKRGPNTTGWLGISLTKDPTICSCEYRRCEYRIRWRSIWGHETLSWVGETHVSAATGAFGGAPYGATKRFLGWVETHANCATGAFG